MMMIASSSRTLLLALLAFLAGMNALPASIVTSIAVAAPAQPPTSGLLPLPERHQSSESLSEVSDLLVAPIDATMSASDVMRARPLILDWNANPVFALNGGRAEPFGLDEARADLDRFLGLRGLSAAQRSQALALFDNEQVTRIVPSPALRAALLML